MTIIVRRNGGALEVVSGRHRLKALIHIYGKAIVTDVESQEQFEVHEVDGQIIVLQSPAAAAAETTATAAIARANRNSREEKS